MADKIQLRRDTAANWTSANPILAQGESGYEIDTGRIKIGDGTTDWNTLTYRFESGGGSSDHGNLTGLTDDDHPQYLNETRHDSLPADNPHNVTATQTGAYTTAQTDSQISSAISAHEVAGDPHPQYVQESDLDTEISNNTNVVANTAKTSFPEAPNDGQQYARQSESWQVVTGGGGGVTDHGALTGLTDDDHTQYLTEARHDTLPSDNPHNVDATQVGLGNVDNTSDLNKPISTATQTELDLKLEASDISDFETSTELDARDIANRSRTNHTGTQTASTISDFTTQVKIDETTTSLSLGAEELLTYTDEDGGVTNLQLNVFGTEAEDFIDTSNTNITTSTPFAVRTFTTSSKPSGRYRVAMIVQLEPASASSNYEFSLRINGTQIGLELEEEGKDVGGDQRNLRPMVGYFNHTGPSTFNIELWASREGNTLVLHGVSAEVWRVS